MELRKDSPYVLLVDDEDDILEIHRVLIEDLGVDVESASNGEEALKLLKVRAYPPLLVLSDIRMPIMDGMELLRQCSKIYPDLPFVFVTGHAEKDMAMEGMRLGARARFEKPARPKDLLDLVERYHQEYHQNLEKEARDLQELRQVFNYSAEELLSGLDQTIQRLEKEDDPAVLDSIFRRVHSLKSSAGLLPEGGALEDLAHHFEGSLVLLRRRKIEADRDLVELYLQVTDLCSQLFEHIRKDIPLSHSLQKQLKKATDSLQSFAPRGEQSLPFLQSSQVQVEKKIDENDYFEVDRIHVNIEKLQKLTSISEEMQKVLQRMNLPHCREHQSPLFQRLLHLSDQVAKELWEVRQISFKKLMGRITRSAREAAKRLGKRIRVDIVGGEILIEQNIANALGQSLIHLVRNSVDHGIESSSERLSTGKQSEGNIRLIAAEGSFGLRVEIEDDGKGLSKELILKKAQEVNLITALEAESMSDDEIFDLIFHPGFSTAAVEGQISGRGVGMDVVSQTVGLLGGTIWIQGRRGGGTRIIIQIPSHQPLTQNIGQVA